MKLWTSENNIDKTIEKFTIGQDNVLDLELAHYDVLGSKAHAEMLENVGLISEAENTTIQGGLDTILKSVEEGSFVIADGVEDIHSQVEILLTDLIGDAAKKLHTARSRNDQVLLDLRLYFRDKIEGLIELTKDAVEAFATKSEVSKNYLMPGYTHTQLGMVSSYGLWFGCYAEALVDDYHQLQSTHKRINQNPLGSAAGYGSSFPIDRMMTTKSLGFDNLCYNAMYAQFGRGKTELVISQAIAGLAFTISKFAYDVCLYSNQDFDLVKLPETHTTGSSIMPHKKNPDVFELIRARCNQLQSLPTQVLMIIQNLPSGYHRDFQQLKELLFPAFGTLKDILEILIDVIPKVIIKKDALNQSKYDLLYTVDSINVLIQGGMSMRDAYFQVKDAVVNGTFKPIKDLHHVHAGSIGNLCTEEILKKMEV